MLPGNGWHISINGGLQAHFRQPNGTSRAGTDWAVGLNDGKTEQRVLVRTYSEDVVGMTPEKQAQLVIEFVTKLFETGWKPSDYSGKPGELTVPGTNPRVMPHSEAPRPWWRFW